MGGMAREAQEEGDVKKKKKDWEFHKLYSHLRFKLCNQKDK